MDPLGADMHRYPVRPASNAGHDVRPSWTGFLGGIVVLALSVLLSVGLWHVAGRSAPPLTTAELIEMEWLLYQLGFPPGPADGAIDAQTRNAIRDFQVTSGLDVDGVPSAALLDELRAAKAEMNAS